MDRWGEGDGQERGPTQPLRGVSKLGMGSFVQSSTGMGSDVGDGQEVKIQVVMSRREQKRQEMPPPPPMHRPAAVAAAAAAAPAAQTAAGPPGSFRAPAWAGNPTSGASLEVSKGGEVIEHIALDRPANLFGRSPAADVVLDHPSLSRQHAAVCFERTGQHWMLLDLNSAHGTFLDGRQVSKGVPVELQPGSRLRFAASSREYALRITPRPAEQPAAPQRSKLWAQQPIQDHQHRPVSGGAQEGSSDSKAKRKREVLEAERPDDTARHDGNGTGAAGAEQVRSTLDSRSPSGRVGPAPDPAPGGSGRFQNLVQVRVLKDRGGQPDQLQRRAAEADRGRLQHAQQPFQERSIYAWLPPPGSSAKAS